MAAQGYETNRQSIPGTRYRPDAINVQTGEIRELKPDTPSGRAAGRAQLERYREAAETAFKKTFKVVLDLYRVL